MKLSPLSGPRERPACMVLFNKEAEQEKARRAKRVDTPAYMPDDYTKIAERVETNQPHFCPRCGQNRNIMWERSGLPPSDLLAVMTTNACSLCEVDMTTRALNMLSWLMELRKATLGGKK